MKRDDKNLLILAGIVALATFGTGAAIVYTQTRGLRNNNPGNIKKGSQWIGLAPDQTDETFARFLAPEFGIRAMGYLLRKYANDYNLRTVRKIISRWSATDQEPYISYVASKLGVSPDTTIDVQAKLVPIMQAITRFENARLQPYPVDVWNKAVQYLNNSATAQLAATEARRSYAYV